MQFTFWSNNITPKTYEPENLRDKQLVDTMKDEPIDRNASGQRLLTGHSGFLRNLMEEIVASLELKRR